MAVLIDTLVGNHPEKTNTNIDGKWVIARPLNRVGLFTRIKDAILILLNIAEAYRYYKQ